MRRALDMEETMETQGGEFTAVDARTGEPVELAMQRLVLEGTVLPIGARLRVRHLFATAGDDPLEAVYSFILPRDAALRRFEVKGPDFTAHSELHPVAEAERTYEEGLEAGHLATFARAYRDGLVNLALGNLRKGEPVMVILEILAGVESSDDGYRFRFPFTMAPSYHAGARVAALPGGGAIELPEDRFGDVLLPEFRTDASGLHEIGFSLDVPGLGEGVEVSSPSHSIRVGAGTDGLRVSLATAGDVPNRDLVLDVAVERPRIVALGGPAEDGKRHFGVVVPSTALGEREGGPRSVVFLLDRSGSMSGEPLEQARRALAACLATLGEADRFGIVAFDDRTELFAETLEFASKDRRQAAAGWLEGIGARGGTELAAGVARAAELLDGGGDIFVLTDGEVFGTEDVLASAEAAGARLHTLGIGSASQDRFLTLLARRTGGVSRFVTPGERVDVAALDLFASVQRPVATGLEVKPDGMENCDLRPEPPSTVFAGTPVVLWGEADGETSGALELSWTRGEEGGTLRVPLDLDDAHLGETVRLLRGARLITDMESTMGDTVAEGAAGRRTAKRVTARLESLSRRFGLASRAMALVAVVERQGDRPGDVPVTQVIPVGLPEAMRPEGVFGEAHVAAFSLAEPAELVDAECFDAIPCSVSLHFEGDADVMHDVAYSLEDQEESSSHDLIDLLGLLEPDGGAPGDTLEERILGTVLILLAAVAEGSTRKEGPYRAHIGRMLSFLEANLPGGLDTEKHKAVRAAIAAAEAGEVKFGGYWFDQAVELVLNEDIDTAPDIWDSLIESAEDKDY